MAELSVAHRAALAQILEHVPDRTLAQLAQAVPHMGGERARALQAMLAAEGVDRARRARAFAPLIPLFRPRIDGVGSIVFPAGVLPRLWKIASARERDLLPILDERDEREAGRVAMVCGRLCLAAAAAARDQAEAVWPAGWSEPEVRVTGLAELASCFDLGPLAHRGLPSLGAWVGRPDGDQTAELRLLVRDAADVAPDGAQRLLEILFGHLGEAALILRLVVLSSTSAGRETFLAESEFAGFVDRLIQAVETRVAGVAGNRSPPGRAGVEPLMESVAWSASVLTELDVTIELRPGGTWGKQVRDARARVTQTLSARLAGVEKAVERALPTVRMQTSGRMSRVVPKLDEPTAGDQLDAARAALTLLRAVRSAAAVFGCEKQRWTLREGLKDRLTTYAEGAVDGLNGGDWPDEVLALERIAVVAEFLELIDATDEARTVRRRAAVAGAPRDPSGDAKASPQAA